jgi:hypothetical protein
LSYEDLKIQCRARFKIEGDFHFISDYEHTYVQVNSQSTLELIYYYSNVLYICMTAQHNAKTIQPGHVYLLLKKLIKSSTLTELQAIVDEETRTSAH